MEINFERLKRNIIKIGEIGKTDNGITRLAYSQEYNKARKELMDLMISEHLTVTIDKVGNLIGRREGKFNLPSIMLGSHLDTVKNGGLLDGNLGVIAALECISVLNDNNIITNHPIEIVAFTAEEGSEMGGTFGSRVMMGRQNTNSEGLPEKLAYYDMTIEDIKDSVRDTNGLKAFLELHIEQGGILEKNKLPIGIVNGIAGVTRYKIIINGEANHAGTTPMYLRKDALLMASKIILKINEISCKMGDPFVATIGIVELFPGSVNVIPGKVELTLEMRDLEQKRIECVVHKIKEYINKQQDFNIDLEFMIEKPPVKTSNDIIQIIEESCNEQEVEYMIIASGAGHDAKEIANCIPTGMIFVPSRDGKSHCAEEYTDWNYIKTGFNILLQTLLKLDKSVEELNNKLLT